MTTTDARTRRAANGKRAAPTTVRVAIYCRKSVDKGDGGEFGSIDAQREAVEAYVKSQAGHGWVALPERYDDLGWSGAKTNRPAFQRLMAEVEARRVDIVAVYKADRLSRSLAHFAQLIETFDQHDVAFVSTTQAFDTSSPMGRLTLNVLMSFAEFERETIAERVRDKVAASRRKGLWTGGRPVLGYDAVDRKLVVNADEAKQVEAVYRLFLELDSLTAVLEELRRRGWRNKTWTNTKGVLVLGTAFSKDTLRKLLSNPLYVGQIRQRRELHEGAHEAIVERDVWDAVQNRLKEHKRSQRRPRTNGDGALLQGLLRCGVCGAAMVRHYAARGGRRWEYYVCLKAMKQGAKTCPGSRAPAAQLEAVVIDRIRAIGSDPALLADALRAASEDRDERMKTLSRELHRAQKNLPQLEAERVRLVDVISQNGNGASSLVQRLTEVEVAAQEAQQRTTAMKAELALLKSQDIDEDELRAALSSFLPAWDGLLPRERARLLALIIDHVAYDAPASEVAIAFRPCGIRTLLEENAT